MLYKYSWKVENEIAIPKELVHYRQNDGELRNHQESLRLLVTIQNIPIGF